MRSIRKEEKHLDESADDDLRDLRGELASRRRRHNAEVTRLRAALDEAQTLIRSAAPLSWAAGGTGAMEDNAYAWEKKAVTVLDHVDAALAEEGKTK